MEIFVMKRRRRIPILDSKLAYPECCRGKEARTKEGRKEAKSSEMTGVMGSEI